MRAYCILIIASFLIIGCHSETDSRLKSSNIDTFQEVDRIGNYVSEEYERRSEGYDWVAVSVSEVQDDQLKIVIRSRADRKKPTCTFDAVATKVTEQIYETEIKGNTVQFQFSESRINISSKEEDDSHLYFYCSGGASIGGTYSKINQALDQSQIDKTTFNKTLNFQGLGFNISSIEKNNKNTVSIFTYGLEEVEYDETLNIEGESVVNAEVEDLNGDGSPELFIYTRSVGSGSYGNVYAFSVNNGKSMSRVYFQPTAENPGINKGYLGHDEFFIIENYLGQRFPIYKEGDTNAKPTGGMRQVMYKMVDGEAMKKLEVVKVSE